MSLSEKEKKRIEEEEYRRYLQNHFQSDQNSAALKLQKQFANKLRVRYPNETDEWIVKRAKEMARQKLGVSSDSKLSVSSDSNSTSANSTDSSPVLSNEHDSMSSLLRRIEKINDDRATATENRLIEIESGLAKSKTGWISVTSGLLFYVIYVQYTFFQLGERITILEQMFR